MHPYCLKLHVEEGGEREKGHPAASLGEVWRYERPTDESDEEINVVSDEEAAVRETRGQQEEMGHDGGLLKSVLVNGSSPRAPPCREKKRVSFGPVQVASFDESEEKGLNETSEPLNITKAPESLSGLELESSETNGETAEAVAPRGQRKARSLSLQQYRQLRLKRRPLVEKQRNYTTQWPSVPELPTELPPILCLGPKTAEGRITPGYRSPHPRLRTESPYRKSSLNVPGPAVRHSPAKKAAVFSSDPPNPVLLPLPVSQTTTDSSSNADSSPQTVREIKTGSSAPQNRFTGTAPAPRSSLTQDESASGCRDLHPHKHSVGPTREAKPEPKTPEPETPHQDPPQELVCAGESGNHGNMRVFNSYVQVRVSNVAVLLPQGLKPRI